MNKYELTVVVSAKVEDDVRTATIERIKEYITRFGGTVVNVDEWGKRKLAYEIQKDSTTSSLSNQIQTARTKSSTAYVLWKMLFVICALDRTLNQERKVRA